MPPNPKPSGWFTTEKLSTWIATYVRLWCKGRKNPDDTPIPEPDCYAIDLSDPDIRAGLLTAISDGWIATGYHRGRKIVRMSEKLHIALQSGAWPNGEPVTLENAAAASAWIWNDENLATIDEEGEPI